MTLSRQRVWQLRMRAQCRCEICGEPVDPALRAGREACFCVEHDNPFRQRLAERRADVPRAKPVVESGKTWPELVAELIK